MGERACRRLGQCADDPPSPQAAARPARPGQEDIEDIRKLTAEMARIMLRAAWVVIVSRGGTRMTNEEGWFAMRTRLVRLALVLGLITALVSAYVAPQHAAA